MSVREDPPEVKSEEVGLGDALATSALQGFTFNTADEMASASDALMRAKSWADFKDIYSAGQEKRRKHLEDVERDHGTVATVASIAGSLPHMLIPGLGAAKLVKATQAVRAGAKVPWTALSAFAAKNGALQGGLAGFGGGEDLSRVTNAMGGAAVGGALGAVIPAAGRAAANVGGWAKRIFQKIALGDLSLSDEAVAAAEKAGAFKWTRPSAKTQEITVQASADLPEKERALIKATTPGYKPTVGDIEATLQSKARELEGSAAGSMSGSPAALRDAAKRLAPPAVQKPPPAPVPPEPVVPVEPVLPEPRQLDLPTPPPAPPPVQVPPAIQTPPAVPGPKAFYNPPPPPGPAPALPKALAPLRQPVLPKVRPQPVEAPPLEFFADPDLVKLVNAAPTPKERGKLARELYKDAKAARDKAIARVKQENQGAADDLELLRRQHAQDTTKARDKMVTAQQAKIDAAKAARAAEEKAYRDAELEAERVAVRKHNSAKFERERQFGLAKAAREAQIAKDKIRHDLAVEANKRASAAALEAHKKAALAEAAKHRLAVAEAHTTAKQATHAKKLGAAIEANAKTSKLHRVVERENEVARITRARGTRSLEDLMEAAKTEKDPHVRRELENVINFALSTAPLEQQGPIQALRLMKEPLAAAAHASKQSLARQPAMDLSTAGGVGGVTAMLRALAFREGLGRLPNFLAGAARGGEKVADSAALRQALRTIAAGSTSELVR